MTKKFLIIVSLLLSLLFISTASFAANAMNAVNNVLHHNVAAPINNLHHNTHHNMHTPAGTAGAVRHAPHHNAAGTTNHRNANTVRRTTPYRTTRTSTTPNNQARTRANTLTWVVLAVTGVVIVGLIWYFASVGTRRDR